MTAINMVGINGVVIVESPFKGNGTVEDIQRNTEFARNVCRDLALKGYAPYASHLFFPQFLNEEEERQLGIDLGLIFAQQCAPSLVVFALRPGDVRSPGMLYAWSRWLDNMRETGYPERIVICYYEQDGQFIEEGGQATA